MSQRGLFCVLSHPLSPLPQGKARNLLIYGFLTVLIAAELHSRQRTSKTRVQMYLGTMPLGLGHLTSLPSLFGIIFTLWSLKRFVPQANVLHSSKISTKNFMSIQLADGLPEYPKFKRVDYHKKKHFLCLHHYCASVWKYLHFYCCICTNI